MSEVLYRKWRPGTMSTLLGQDHVTHTLKQAVIRNRLAHAYLFCGPRGTGKTSTARILAKAINCVAPVDGEPDNSCHVCLSINESRSLDLIEIDAASNRRIADVRDLTEKIHYSPSESKFKIYIIDEVHMLTNEAFNALLKTLEEPPAHALLILATTEVEKIPLTIVSRCQRFDFRRVSIDTICQKLQNLCDSEDVTIEKRALELIATKSTGSLRDAENILEQGMVTYGENINEKDIRELLHLGEDFSTVHLLDNIVSGEPDKTIRTLSGLISDGHDATQIKDNMLDLVRHTILHISGVEVPSHLRDDINSFVDGKSDEVNVPQLVNLAKILNGTDFRNSMDRVLPLEIALVEASVLFTDGYTQNTSMVSPKSPLNQPVPNGNTANPSSKPKISNIPRKTSFESREIQPDNKQSVSPAVTNHPPPTPVAKPEVSIRDGVNGELDQKWNELLRGLRQTGNRFNVGALLRGCVSKTIDDNNLIFYFRHSSHVDRIKSEIENVSVLNQFKETVNDVLGVRYEIRVELLDNAGSRNGKSASQKSHLVRAAQSLGAQIVEEREKSD